MSAASSISPRYAIFSATGIYFLLKAIDCRLILRIEVVIRLHETLYIIKHDTEVEIAVSDRGCGISEADKAKIFDRFYRVSDSKNLPGIGLGLAYVKQVVTAHGGEISVTDRDNGGTTFTIKIPQ